MQFIQKIGYKSGSYIRAKVENIRYYPFHVHDDSYEIICVLDGRVRIYDAAASYILQYGDVHIFNRHDPHKIEAFDENDCIILTVQFSHDHYVKKYPELQDAYFISDAHINRNIYSSDNSSVRFQLASIYREYSGSGSDITLEALAHSLIETLISQYQNYVYRDGPDCKANIVRLENTSEDAPAIYKNIERMYRVVDYIYEHYSERLTLKQIAEMEYVSEAHLSKYIKQNLGMTFSQLLSLARCEEAALLLASSNNTMDQIAESVGFANRTHFANQFMRWYNIKPSEYRKEILKDLTAEAITLHDSFDYDFALRIIDIYLDEY